MVHVPGYVYQITNRHEILKEIKQYCMTNDYRLSMQNQKSSFGSLRIDLCQLQILRTLDSQNTFQQAKAHTTCLLERK